MRRGMLSKTQREKKKTRGRRHKPQHAKKNKKKTKRTCARSFSTGEENMMGRKDRYVLRITHATHLCYASTGPLLLPFETCRRPTTRTSQGMTHPTPPTTHREHTHAHARQPHRARPPPPTPPTPTRRATQRTHTHQGQGEGHPEDTPTAPPHHTTTGSETQPGVAGVAHRNLRQEWRGTNHTSHKPTTHATAARRTPHTTHRTPRTTADSETQQGVAGNRARDPPPGVARNADHRRQRNPARSGGE